MRNIADLPHLATNSHDHYFEPPVSPDRRKERERGKGTEELKGYYGCEKEGRGRYKALDADLYHSFTMKPERECERVRVVTGETLRWGYMFRL